MRRPEKRNPGLFLGVFLFVSLIAYFAGYFILGKDLGPKTLYPAGVTRHKRVFPSMLLVRAYRPLSEVESKLRGVPVDRVASDFDTWSRLLRGGGSKLR